MVLFKINLPISISKITEWTSFILGIFLEIVEYFPLIPVNIQTRVQPTTFGRLVQHNLPILFNPSTSDHLVLCQTKLFFFACYLCLPNFSLSIFLVIHQFHSHLFLVLHFLFFIDFFFLVFLLYFFSFSHFFHSQIKQIFDLYYPLFIFLY